MRVKETTSKTVVSFALIEARLLQHRAGARCAQQGRVEFIGIAQRRDLLCMLFTLCMRKKWVSERRVFKCPVTVQRAHS